MAAFWGGEVLKVHYFEIHFSVLTVGWWRLNDRPVDSLKKDTEGI
jgi:hypothetical protein